MAMFWKSDGAIIESAGGTKVKRDTCERKKELDVKDENHIRRRNLNQPYLPIPSPLCNLPTAYDVGKPKAQGTSSEVRNSLDFFLPEPCLVS